MLPEQLQAIRERAEKATPGPWDWRLERQGDVERVYHHPSLLAPDGTPVANANDGLGIDSEYTVCESKDDALFIAHAREDIPALLTEVERLQAESERWQYDAAMWTGYSKDFERRLVASLALAKQLAEALHFTQEYVGEATLPALPGWSWYDATQAYEVAMGGKP